MKKLTIVWQRLILNKKTCKRCGSTEAHLESALKKLKRLLKVLEMDVTLKKESIDVAVFKKAPSRSNRIWIAKRPLEDWLDANVGQSPCCDVCGDAECRTIELDGSVHDTIPEKLIIKACLIAAAGLI